MLKLCILGMSIALVGGVGVVSMSATHEQNENVVNINKENKKLVSYDDGNYTITLSTSEVQNYTWSYLYNDGGDITTVNLTYNSVSYGNATDDGNYVSWTNESNIIYLVLDAEYFNDENGTHFENYQWCFNEVSYLDHDLILEFETESDYLNYKEAVELDIQANMDSSNVMPSIADLFQQVTAAVNAFIGSLGDAFTQVTSLFWVTTGENQGPTFLGMLILIGVGVGLVYFVYRVIKGLVHRI